MNFVEIEHYCSIIVIVSVSKGCFCAPMAAIRVIISRFVHKVESQKLRVGFMAKN